MIVSKLSSMEGSTYDYYADLKPNGAYLTESFDAMIGVYTEQSDSDTQVDYITVCANDVDVDASSYLKIFFLSVEDDAL